MKDWLSLAVAFAFGLAAGVAFGFFLFESRARFYKEFIEHRLASINRLYSQEGTTRGLPILSSWRGRFKGRSRPGQGP